MIKISTLLCFFILASNVYTSPDEQCQMRGLYDNLLFDAAWKCDIHDFRRYENPLLRLAMCLMKIFCDKDHQTMEMHGENLRMCCEDGYEDKNICVDIWGKNFVLCLITHHNRYKIACQGTLLNDEEYVKEHEDGASGGKRRKLE